MIVSRIMEIANPVNAMAHELTISRRLTEHTKNEGVFPAQKSVLAQLMEFFSALTLQATISNIWPRVAT